MRKQTERKIMLYLELLALLTLSLVFAPASQAGLKAVGPTDPATGFPAWYQDDTGLSLAPCFDLNGFCSGTTAAFPNPAAPVSTPTGTNFPDEGFYFLTNATAGGTLYEAAVEFAFGGTGAVTPGQEITFSRIRLVNVNAAAGTYTVTHPYGTVNLSAADTAAGIKFTEDLGDVGAQFQGVLTAKVGPFLVRPTGFVTSLDGKVYIGDSVSFGPVSGTTVTAVNITGPTPGSTANFTLEGKVLGVTASPASLVFPAQQAGVVTSRGPITITNIDTVNIVTLGTASFTGANAADFTVGTDLCSGVTLSAAGDVGGVNTCTVTVNFSEALPGVNGVKSALLSFSTGTVLPPVVINLSGTIDNVPPTVTSTIPAVNDINHPANNAITATFSEVVTNTTTTTFTLAGPDGAVAGTVTFNAGSKTATFTPAANLTTNATYTATITTGVTDIAGNALAQNFVWSFTATFPDTSAPAIVSHVPDDQDVGVRTDGVITITFNSPVLASTINPANFTVSTPSGEILCHITYDSATRTATLAPELPLQYKQSYLVEITTGVQSLGGVPMAAEHQFTFVTNAAPTASTLLSPADGATGIPTTVDLKWTKSTDDDATDTLTYHLYVCTNPFMNACNPTDIAAAPSSRGMFAGAGGYGAGMLLAGLALIGGVKSRKSLYLFLAVLLISGMAVSACSNNDDDAPASTIPADQIVTKNVAGLEPQKLYYWKVVSDDGKGALISSATWSFTTQ